MTRENNRLVGRNGEVWTAYLDGLSQDAIAEKFGISQSRVSQILAKVRESIPPPVLADIRQKADEQISILYAETMDIMRAQHPLVSVTKGSLIYDDRTGKVLLDDGPKLAAIAMALRIQERIAKAHGTDAATKVETSGTVKFEIVGVDVDNI